MKRVLFSFCLIAFSFSPIIGFAGPVDACAPDIQKFCKDIKPGQGAILKCLRDHKAEVSQACKSQGQAMKNQMKETQEACKADAEKLCKGMSPGHGNIRKCLMEKESDLSAQCKSSIEAMKSMVMGKGAPENPMAQPK